MATIINTLEKRASAPKTNMETEIKKKSQFISPLKKYFLLPIESGLYGFYMVFAVLLFLKLATYIFGFNDTFQLELIDFMLSLVGFFLMFLVDLLKKLNL
jgi:hypothetical protein